MHVDEIHEPRSANNFVIDCKYASSAVGASKFTSLGGIRWCIVLHIFIFIGNSCKLVSLNLVTYLKRSHFEESKNGVTLNTVAICYRCISRSVMFQCSRGICRWLRSKFWWRCGSNVVRQFMTTVCLDEITSVVFVGNLLYSWHYFSDANCNWH